MATPYHHAKSSVKKFGGSVGDYISIHEWIDASKAYMGDFRHRALRHHAQGIFECAARFGDADGCIINGNKNKVYVRLIAEQHIIEDCGYIPTLEDWFSYIQPQGWMNAPRKLSQED